MLRVLIPIQAFDTISYTINFAFRQGVSPFADFAKRARTLQFIKSPFSGSNVGMGLDPSAPLAARSA